MRGSRSHGTGMDYMPTNAEHRFPERRKDEILH